MSTHECLWVTGDRERYGEADLLLHTTHTGMDARKWVFESFGVLAGYYAFMYERRGSQSKESVTDFLFRSGQLDDNVWYPPSVAVAIMASHPYTFLPVPMNDASQLADWSGADNPLVLHLDRDAGVWTLKRKKSGRARTINPRGEFVKAIDKLLSSGSSKPKRRKAT